MIREHQLPPLEDGHPIPPAPPARHLKPRAVPDRSAVQKLILRAKYGQSVTVNNYIIQSITNAAKRLGIETRKQIVSGRGAARVNRIWFLPDANATVDTQQDPLRQKIKDLQRDNWRLSKALSAIIRTSQELKSILSAAEELLKQQAGEVTLIKAKVKKPKSTTPQHHGPARTV